MFSTDPAFHLSVPVLLRWFEDQRSQRPPFLVHLLLLSSAVFAMTVKHDGSFGGNFNVLQLSFSDTRNLYDSFCHRWFHSLTVSISYIYQISKHKTHRYFFLSTMYIYMLTLSTGFLGHCIVDDTIKTLEYHFLGICFQSVHWIWFWVYASISGNLMYRHLNIWNNVYHNSFLFKHN